MWHPLPNPPPKTGEGVSPAFDPFLSLPRLRGRVGEGVARVGGA